jgi:hypothetical protein
VLNVRNGALLVKGGALQTGCGCCGGWYCYCEKKVTFTISGYSAFYPFQSLVVDGTYVLSFTNCGLYEGLFQPNPCRLVVGGASVSGGLFIAASGGFHDGPQDARFYVRAIDIMTTDHLPPNQQVPPFCGVWEFATPFGLQGACGTGCSPYSVSGTAGLASPVNGSSCFDWRFEVRQALSGGNPSQVRFTWSATVEDLF